MANAKRSMIRSIPASINAPSWRIFNDRPTVYLNEQFNLHIRKTGQPETFPGIHPGPIAKDEPFIKLMSFSIEGKARLQGDLAPCPMCRPNKYLHGFLIYLLRLKAVAAIGHCCADKETLAAADREFKARQTRDSEEGYLLTNIPLVPSRLRAAENVRPSANEALRVFRHFRRDGAEFRRALNFVKKQVGRLTLSEVIDGETAAYGPAGFGRHGAAQTRDIEFGILSGIMALNADYNPVAELDRISQALRPHDRGTSEEAALN
jgi:hypothetical protein